MSIDSDKRQCNVINQQQQKYWCFFLLCMHILCVCARAFFCFLTNYLFVLCDRPFGSANVHTGNSVAKRLTCCTAIRGSYHHTTPRSCIYFHEFIANGKTKQKMYIPTGQWMTATTKAAAIAMANEQSARVVHMNKQNAHYYSIT